MISQFTKSGTKVICIDASSASSTFRGFWRLRYAEGEIYTVHAIVIHEVTGTPVVQLTEHPIIHGRPCGLNLHRFRYLELPKSITECLTSQPLIVESEMTGATSGGLVAPVLSQPGIASYLNFTASRCSLGAKASALWKSDCEPFGSFSSLNLLAGVSASASLSV